MNELHVGDTLEITLIEKFPMATKYTLVPFVGDPIICVVPIPYDWFWEKVEKSDNCWVWTGAKRVSGKVKYGMIKVSGKGLYAHRFSYQISIGKIPENLLVCHKCDNPLCVRPDHLFIGTHKENMNDMVNKGRGAWQKKRK